MRRRKNFLKTQVKRITLKVTVKNVENYVLVIWHILELL